MLNWTQVGGAICVIQFGCLHNSCSFASGITVLLWSILDMDCIKCTPQFLRRSMCLTIHMSPHLMIHFLKTPTSAVSMKTDTGLGYGHSVGGGKNCHGNTDSKLNVMNTNIETSLSYSTLSNDWNADTNRFLMSLIVFWIIDNTSTKFKSIPALEPQRWVCPAWKFHSWSLLMWKFTRSFRM